ncbi:MAG: ATP-binding protein [Nanoarchaeota archaeon]
MIQERLILQQRELQQKKSEHYLLREIELPQTSLIRVILGPRRAGKSTFAIHALSEPFAYANFDDEALSTVKNYDEIVAVLDQLYQNPETYLFDEIQNLPRWELFANRLHRRGKRLILTGSNAHLLSKELATHLTGRHQQLVLFPFSFSETLGSEKKNFISSEIAAKLESYILTGGYPEPFLQKTNVKEYLSTLFTSIIYKDVVKRYRIRNPSAIDDLAVYLLSNVAKEFSFRTLTKIGQCKSVGTVEKYLHYLEEAFLFFQIKQFSFKLKEQVARNKKIYCIDNGFITAKAFQLTPDLGRLYENCVAVQLKKQELRGEHHIYFWKDSQQNEIDFVVKEGLKVAQLIQVCSAGDNRKTKEREIRALLKASQELRCDNLLIITRDKETEETAEWFGIKRKIKYLPLWKWLTL